MAPPCCPGPLARPARTPDGNQWELVRTSTTKLLKLARVFKKSDVIRRGRGRPALASSRPTRATRATARGTTQPDGDGVMRYRLACVAFACSLLLPEASSFCMQRVHHVKRGRAGLIVAGLSPATLAKPTLPYDWTRQWYAVDFVKNVPSTPDPMPYAVFGHSLVLWRDETGTIRALEDRCPHRAARLSEGQVRDGRIECSYHGWQVRACARAPGVDVHAPCPSGGAWPWSPRRTLSDDALTHAHAPRARVRAPLRLSSSTAQARACGYRSWRRTRRCPRRRA